VRQPASSRNTIARPSPPVKTACAMDDDTPLGTPPTPVGASPSPQYQLYTNAILSISNPNWGHLLHTPAVFPRPCHHFDSPFIKPTAPRTPLHGSWCTPPLDSGASACSGEPSLPLLPMRDTFQWLCLYSDDPVTHKPRSGCHQLARPRKAWRRLLRRGGPCIPTRAVQPLRPPSLAAPGTQHSRSAETRRA